MRKLVALGRVLDIEVRVDCHRGKGSHHTIYFGTACQVIPDLRRELKTGTLRGILKKLGVPRSVWQEN